VEKAGDWTRLDEIRSGLAGGVQKEVAGKACMVPERPGRVEFR
jgi:hypothetical protein